MVVCNLYFSTFHIKILIIIWRKVETRPLYTQPFRRYRHFCKRCEWRRSEESCRIEPRTRNKNTSEMLYTAMVPCTYPLFMGSMCTECRLYTHRCTHHPFLHLMRLISWPMITSVPFSRLFCPVTLCCFVVLVWCILIFGGRGEKKGRGGLTGGWW